MRNFFGFFLFFLGVCPLTQAQSVLWQVLPNDFRYEGVAPILPAERFRSFQTDEQELQGFLQACTQTPQQAQIISLPSPEGTFREFRIWESSMMEPGLALKYPFIKTYTAEAVNNRQVTAKIDYTLFGFHAYVFDPSGNYLIDPYTSRPSGHYVAYYRSDYHPANREKMICELAQSELGKEANPYAGYGLSNGTVQKTYRLALAADSEYCAAVVPYGPTKPLVLSKMVTTMNRVNGVYERELAIHLTLVANTDDLIFITNSPYSNYNGGTMLGQNQTTVDNVIGSANYDIGHVFSTGGGGIASRASVCRTSNKAQGVTGSPAPYGDAFDIDYVCHEMGHQFGANHTFNANTGSCFSNGVASRAYEPGSGTTIMAYAGICGSGNDYQAHSDPYFHSASLEEISNYITLPNTGGTCPSTQASSNTNASMPAFDAKYSIPYKTPFELSGPIASDATADTITYTWEERDLGDFKSTLSNTHLNGPLFRCYQPTPATTRVFPALKWLTIGANPMIRGEKLPDTARTMVFRLVERDVYQGWGTFNFSNDAITLDVVNTGIPFEVTAPATGAIWQGGGRANITWNVAQTDLAPIGAATVDIYLSTDGGYTYPTLLRAAALNNGKASVMIPNINTSTARIKVKGSGNVFFNINEGEFSIQASNVGLDPVAALEAVQLFPNPAKDVINISFPESLGKVQLSLQNTLGQKVLSRVLSGRNSIVVSELPSGLYQVVLSKESVPSIVRKLVIQ
ncbi:MAG: T9SS type A sorting domain-containing protein [Bacteroidetes bacterium]|nr:T9SS type A sorting domain-containing protein [Bacteroidota bacterium]